MANNTFFDTSELNYTYTHIDNSVVDDTDLKPEHLGVMLMIYRYKNLKDCSLSIKFLADKCTCSRDRMTKICNDLEAHGYLERDVFRDKKGQTATVFRVHPDPKGLGKRYEKQAPNTNDPEAPEPDKPEAEAEKTDDTEQLTLEGAPVKEVGTSKKKTKKSKEPYAGQPAEVVEAIEAQPAEVVEAIVEFAEMRKAKKKAITTAGTWKRLLDRLEKLSAGDAALKVKILHRSTDKAWDDIYELPDWYGGRPAMATAGDAGTEAIVAEIYKTAAYSTYGSLSAQAKALITETQFEELQTINAEAYSRQGAKYKAQIKKMIKA